MLKTVTIQADIPDSSEYEPVAYRLPKDGDWYVIGSRFQMAHGDHTEDGSHPRLVYSKPEPIPEGVYWLEKHGAFVDSNGVSTPDIGGEFYTKWLPRAAEFPKYEPPKMVPLGKQDILPNSCVKGRGNNDPWQTVQWACGEGIYLPPVGSTGCVLVKYEDLMGEGWSIISPGKQWSECSKPA